MISVFKPFLTRTMALFACLGLGFVQTGCAHDVYVEPSVVVHSRMGHFGGQIWGHIPGHIQGHIQGHIPGHIPGHFQGQLKVHAPEGIPGAVVFLSPPQVFYAPPPPPRVIYLPPGVAPVHAWGHGHDRFAQDRRNPWGAEHGWGGYRGHDARHGDDRRGYRDGHGHREARGHRDGRYR